MNSDEDDDIKPVKNLPIYRKAARDLMVQQYSLDMFGFEYVGYYQIVRDPPLARICYPCQIMFDTFGHRLHPESFRDGAIMGDARDLINGII